jgi:hypothetical protein
VVEGEVHLVAIDEGEAGDHLAHDGISLVHATNEHLGVVAEELEGGEHGKAAVVELLVGGLERSLIGGELLEAVLVGERTGAALGGQGEVNEADEEDHLHPAEGRDGLDGGNTVGDGGEGDARGDLTRESLDLRDDVAEDSELGNTAVLELSSSVLGEGIGIDVLGEVKGIEEASGLGNTSLVGVAHLEGGGASRAGGGGEGGGADKGSKDGESTEHFSNCVLLVGSQVQCNRGRHIDVHCRSLDSRHTHTEKEREKREEVVWVSFVRAAC